MDYIIHGASPANGEAFEKFPVETILPNVLGTLKVLEYAKMRGARVLYMSSTAVYGDTRGLVREADYGSVDPLAPRSSYVEAKRLAEQLCVAFWREHGTSSVIARIPYTYAPTYDWERDRRFLPKKIGQILRGEPVEIRHDDAEVQYTYAADVASALLTLLLAGKDGEACNVCNEEAFRVEELLAAVHRAADGQGAFSITGGHGGFPLAGERGINQLMDATKLRALGWHPCFPYKEGAAALVREARL